MNPPRFSPQPGARERHLQRRCDNPLFAPALRQLDATQLEQARRADQEEVEAFGRDLHALLEAAVALPASAETDAILALRERIERSYEQGAGLPGDHRSELQALDRLYQVIMAALRKAAGNDALAHKELDDAEAARTMHVRLLGHALVADLLRPDSPIAADELAATLLSESAGAVAAVVDLFEPAQRAELAAEARHLLEQAKAEGYALPEAWQRLRLIAGTSMSSE